MVIHIVLIKNSGEKFRYNYRIVSERFYRNKEKFESEYRFEKLILDNYERVTEIYLDKDIEEVLEIAFRIDKKMSNYDAYERKLFYCLEAYKNDIEFVLNNFEDIVVIEGDDFEDLGDYYFYELDFFGLGDKVDKLSLYINLEKLGVDMQYNYIKVKGAYVGHI